MTLKERKNLQRGDIINIKGRAYEVTRVCRNHITAHPFPCTDNVFVDYQQWEMLAPKDIAESYKANYVWLSSQPIIESRNDRE